VLSLVDLTANRRRRIEDYSLGMKQRLGLATALLASPDVLVLDEPANGLDPAGNRWLRNFLREFADSGGAVLVSSHVLSDVALIADDIVVIADGKLVWSGPADQLQGAGVVTARVSDPERLARDLDNAAAHVEREGDVLVVTGMTNEDIGALAARAGITIFELASRHRSLEEAFLTLTTQKGHN
jgi:ABC-2 type transport system ATP-binding protein